MKPTEPILIENKNRFVLFPIKHPEIWRLYKKAETNFWFVHEGLFMNDVEEFNTKLTDAERVFISFAIAALKKKSELPWTDFYNHLLQEVQYPEARCFYGYQLMMTSNLSETLSLFSNLFGIWKPGAQVIIPVVPEMSEYICRYCSTEFPFGQRLLNSAIRQRILFSSLYAGLAHIRKKGLMKTFFMTMDFIYIDEGLFADFALSVFSGLKHKHHPDRIEEVIRNTVKLERKFSEENLYISSEAGVKKSDPTGFASYQGDSFGKTLFQSFLFSGQGNPCGDFYWERHFEAIDPDRKDQDNNKEIRFDEDF